MRFLYIPLLCLFIITSCKSDDPVIDPIYTDLVFEIDENPEMGQLVGIVDSTDATGNLKLTYMDQIPLGAVDFNETTGEITISNPDIFDAEVTPEVYVSIRGKNDKVINEIEVTIVVEDVYNETDLVIKELVTTNPPIFGNEQFSDLETLVTYENSQFLFMSNAFATGFSEISVEGVETERITSLRTLTDDGEGEVLEQTYNLTYDTDGDILAMDSQGDLGDQNYIIEQDGVVLSFLDQIGLSNGSIEYTFNNRILSYTDELNTITFEYAGANLKTVIVNDSTTATYSYDSKRNPFLAASFLNLSEVINLVNVLKGLQTFDIGKGFKGIYKNMEFQNRNNLVMVEVENPAFGFKNRNYEYLYNSDGYPIQKTIFGINIEVQYIYEE